jgi:deferrochelatase/peroxidase EfeB
MRNGSYAVVRRIRMRLEAWDAETLADQQDVFGRFKVDGAPLSGTRERDTPDFRARRPDGSLVIPRHAHIRLAAPENNGGIRILRRGYSFVERAESGTGRIEAGLFFVAYQKDPRSQFVPLRRRQAADALNEYSEHVGSAVFAMAPGAGDSSDWLGRALLDQRRG